MNLMIRIMSGLVLVFIGIFVLWFGNYYFWVFLLISSLFCSYEIFSMIYDKQKKWLILSLLVVFGLYLGILLKSEQFYYSWFVRGSVCLFLVISVYEIYNKKLFLFDNEFFCVVRVVMLMGFSLPFLYLIREIPNGRFYIFLCCVPIWFTDSFAYFGGRLFGRIKLNSISPNKTIEGSIFGIFGAIVGGLIFSHFFEVPFWNYLFITVVVSILSQLGDLYESLTKRFFHKKDSSHLIPGHGGFFDRADSYLFVAPVFYYLLHFGLI